ncbi:MAG TPA: hypothetical protein VIL46_02580, partial [Gemmataceae bacterium]
SPRGVPPTAAGPVQTAPGGAGESLPAPAPSGGRSGPAAPGSGNVAPLSVRVVAPPVAGLPSNYDPLGVLTRAVPVGPSAEPATPPEDDDVGDTINAVYVGPEPAGVVLPEGDAGGGAGTVTDPLGGFDLDPLAGLIPG